MTDVHATMADKSGCYERNRPNGWTDRLPTEDVQRAAGDFMFRGFTHEQVEQMPLGMVEAMIEWKLASDDLDRAHHHTMAGGGMELSDHVRELLRVEDRMSKIADMHRKAVGDGGLTSGDCTECGWTWPCPTYDWARGDSDRDPTLSCWDRSDDEPSTTTEGD